MRPEPARRALRGAALLLALLALAPCAAPAQQGAADGEAAAALAPLRPGDVVRLSFWREPALSGEYPVDETGSVALPYVGYRDVSALPADELKRRLMEEYGQYLSDQAVQIMLLRRVTILGAVNAPGLYHVDPTMTARDALALAGGVSPHGRPDAIRLRRDGRTIDLGAREADPSLALSSGDELFVPERSWLARNSPVVLGALISAVGFVVGQAVF